MAVAGELHPVGEPLAHSRRQQQLIHVAGMAAEVAWDHRNEGLSEICLEEEMEYALGSMSETDREPFLDDDATGAPREGGALEAQMKVLLKTHRKAFALLRRGGPLWPALIEQARLLMLEASAQPIAPTM